MKLILIRQRGLRTVDSYLATFFGAVAIGMLGVAGCHSPSMEERQAFERMETWGARASSNGLDDTESAVVEDLAGREAAALPDTPALRDYIDYAVVHHPDLRAAFQEWRAALERVPKARSLKDPNLNYTYFVEKSMNVQTITLSQAFPWYDKLRAREARAMDDALAAEQRFEERRLDVVAATKEAYAEYAYVAKALEVARENRRIREGLLAAAEARFESGEVPYADVARAAVAVDESNDKIASLKRRRGALVGRLNAALGRSADKALPWPRALRQPQVELNEEQLLDRLQKTNPELQALRHKTEGLRQNLRLVKQNWIPDLTLGMGYHEMLPDNLENQISVMAGINIPLWWERLKAERKEAKAELQAAKRKEGGRRNHVESKVRLAWYRFHDADRRLELYQQELIPGAEESLDAAEAAYSDGQVEFEAVLQAQSKLQELQLTYERAAADRFQYLATLERLVGGLSSRDAASTEGDSRNRLSSPK